MSALSQVTVPLSRQMMLGAVAELCRRDADLARVVTRHGPPPMWARPPGFATLVRIILEQQVSLSSAKAAFRRLQSGAGRVSAERLSRLSARRITTFGITRQKAEFIHGLATAIGAGHLRLRSLSRSDDLSVRGTLSRIKGIGPWTADIYLVMALRRPDVWPDRDLALVKSLRNLKRLRSDPSPDVVRRIAAAWVPWRAVAARIVWHSYLAEHRNDNPWEGQR
ncbi:MAG: DNA-3-methyladenine glycosylase family protein [bacterium]